MGCNDKGRVSPRILLSHGGKQLEVAVEGLGFENFIEPLDQATPDSLLNRGSADFSWKGVDSKVLGLCFGHSYSSLVLQHKSHRQQQTNGHSCVPIKLLQKQVVGRISPKNESLQISHLSHKMPFLCLSIFGLGFLINVTEKTLTDPGSWVVDTRN